MLFKKLARDLFTLSIEIYLIGVYPIEVYHIGKGAIKISGLPLNEGGQGGKEKAAEELEKINKGIQP